MACGMCISVSSCKLPSVGRVQTPRPEIFCHLNGHLFKLGLADNPGYGKGKAVPLQAWSSTEGSRKFRFPDLMTTAQDGGKVVSLTHRLPLPPGNTPGTHFF